VKIRLSVKVQIRRRFSRSVRNYCQNHTQLVLLVKVSNIEERQCACSAIRRRVRLKIITIKGQ